MKMKKLSIGLGVALCSAFAFMLTSCEGSKKVTYTDENGTEHTVTVKKTSNEDEIAEALTAVVYSKGNAKFKPNGVAVSASLEGKATGTQVSNNKKVSVGGSASAKAMFTFGDYEKTQDISNYASYAEVKVSAQVPTAMISSIGTKKTALTALTAESETDVDYSKTSKLVAQARAYGDKDAVYVNVQKLDLPYDEIEAIKDFKPLINDNIVGKYIKLDELSAKAVGVPSTYTNVLFSMDTYAKMYYEAYKDNSTFIDQAFASLTEDVTTEQFKENIKKSLESADLVISSVDGSKMTLKYKLAKKGLSDEEKKNAYQGDSYMSVTLDIVKKVPTAVKFDASDYAQYMYDKSVEDADTVAFKDVKMTIKGSVSVTYSPKVSKLSQKNKDNATNLPALMALLGAKND